MKQPKQILTPPPIPVNNRFAQYPIIGSVVALFSLNSRFNAAQQALQNSAQGRQALIRSADVAIEASKQRIEETDTLIAESQAFRS